MELNRLKRIAESDFSYAQGSVQSGPTAACELVSRCFAARTAMHIAHLRASTHAEHIILGDFYDEIASLADAFAECYMGATGQILSFPIVNLELSVAPISYLTELRNWVSAHYAESSSGIKELQASVDDILLSIDRTLYKLKFLK